MRSICARCGAEATKNRAGEREKPRTSDSRGPRYAWLAMDKEQTKSCRMQIEDVHLSESYRVTEKLRTAESCPGYQLPADH